MRPVAVAVRSGAVAAAVVALLTFPQLAPAGALSPASATPPTRVASLLPFMSDAVARLGGRARLVASVRRDTWVPPADGVLDLGNPHSPSFEQLAASDAELVVGDRALHGTLRERLARGGAEVLLIDSSSVEATFDGLLALAARVDDTQAMPHAVAAARREISALAVARPLSTLLIFGTPGSFMVMTNRTWLGSLAEVLHLRLPAVAAGAAERHPGFVELGDETLATLDPDLVLLVAHGEPERIRIAFEDRLSAAGVWGNLGGHATARERVHVLPSALFNANPGLAATAAARHLRALASTAAPR